MTARQNEDQSVGQALVVSADATLRGTVQEALEAERFETFDCADAETTVTLLPNLVPVVIVIDSSLEGADAASLCARIRENRKCRYVPIILLSGDDGRDALHRAYDQGFTTVFIKPFGVEFLKQRFRAYGDTGRTISGLTPVNEDEARLLHAIPDAFFEINAKGIVKQHLGGGEKDPLLRAPAMPGKSFGKLWPAATADLVMRNIRRALTTRESCEFQFELSDAEVTAAYEMRLLVQGRDRVLAIIRNISESALAADTRARAGADTLTGLAKHDVFIQQLEAMLADARLRERGLALMCIDIDRFTRINESLGRAVGDAVLRVSASRIQRCLRDADHLARVGELDDGAPLARIGGDEFVVVLGDLESRDAVATIAERVRHSFDEPVAYEGHTLIVTPSIGIAMFPVDGVDGETLFVNARAALDEAKTHGHNGSAFYSDTIKFRSLNRFDLKEELRWAIEKEQLALHYLPRIDLASGRVTGLEALLRWTHPLRGNVPLDQLIPLAETTGLMLPIGEWVLTTACRDARAWSTHAMPPPVVSVNLSQHEFARADLAAMIENALAASELAGQRLQLELTEAMLMRHRRAEGILEELKNLGVQLVIDDFGTGHSSFARLMKFPIDAIKVDRSFVDGAGEDSEQASICAAIIAMAHELGFTVIAEGVETDEQLQFLRERGCDEAQGFLYTEPLPSAAVPGFLEACIAASGDTTVTALTSARRTIA